MQTIFEPGKIKKDIVDFAISNFKKEIERAVEKADFEPPDEIDAINFLGWFILEKPIKNGKTPLELYVERHKELPEEIRRELLRWKDVHKSMFEVKEKRDNGVLLYDLVKGREYFVKPTKEGVIRYFSAGSIIYTRIVPWKDHYLFSGMQNSFAKKDAKVLRAMADIYRENPSFFEFSDSLDIVDELLEKERYEEALEILNGILKGDKDNEEALLLKGEAYFHQNEIKKAIEYFDKCLEINPRNDGAYCYKASAAFLQLRFQEALNHCNKALELNLHNYDAVIMKAFMLYQLGIKEYKKWIERAYSLNHKRTENFMKNYWISEKLNEDNWVTCKKD
ncbi:MAG: tetratricopeptide repeat protein [Euryarchaeota archaeon]|nr:tetratricopeptide repeat protein [Euryarchaeota archaeon]